MKRYNYNEIKVDYEPYNGIFNDDKDERVENIKQILFSDKITEIERRVFILYLTYGTYETLGKILGISTSGAFYHVKQIKNKIKKIYDYQLIISNNNNSNYH